MNKNEAVTIVILSLTHETKFELKSKLTYNRCMQKQES